jgi:hypothetical protein
MAPTAQEPKVAASATKNAPAGRNVLALAAKLSGAGVPLAGGGPPPSFRRPRVVPTKPKNDAGPATAQTPAAVAAAEEDLASKRLVDVLKARAHPKGRRPPSRRLRPATTTDPEIGPAAAQGSGDEYPTAAQISADETAVEKVAGDKAGADKAASEKIPAEQPEATEKIDADAKPQVNVEIGVKTADVGVADAERAELLKLRGVVAAEKEVPLVLCLCQMRKAGERSR